MATVSKKRWLHLSVGAVMMLFLGLIYAWSTFVKPLETEFLWNRAQTSVTFTISIAFFVIGLISSGFISQKFSNRIAILISSASMLAGFLLCSRVTTLTGLYISYGVLIGFGVGVANSAIVSAIVKWFPDKTGAASGILMMGFGLGSLILGRLAVSLIASYGWRSTFMVFGVAFAAIMALGSIWILLPPAGYSVPGTKARAKSAVEGALDIPASKVLARQSFWLYIVWFALMMAGGLIVIGHASPFAQDLGLSESAAAWAVGVFSISNGLGRVLTGIVFDKFGMRRSMLLTTCYIVVASLLLTVSCLIVNIPLMILGFIFAGLSYGGGPTTSSTFAASYYGATHFAVNYGLVSAGMIPGAIIGPALAGMLRTQSGGYLSSFVVMIAFGLVSLVFSRLIRKP